MLNFETEEIEEFKGRGMIKFFSLVINGLNVYQDFEKQIKKEGNRVIIKQLTTIRARMALATGFNLLAKDKFRDVTPVGEAVREYEIKAGDLRVYLIHEERKGHVIVMAGKKSKQEKDYRKFRSIKKEYIEGKG